MSCGFCAPFDMAIDDEEIEAIANNKGSNVISNMDDVDHSSPSMRATASPTLESIPEGFKEKSEDSEDRHMEAEGEQEAETEQDRETLVDEILEEEKEEEEEIIERDFDIGATRLYHTLQSKNWEKVIAHLEVAPEEAKIWITRKDPGNPNKLRWRILPIHASIIFAAPDSVVEALLKVYPAGPKNQDDQGMTPLHLAFRLGAAESVVSLIYASYPEATDLVDKKGRTPLILAQTCKGANKAAFLRVLEQGPRPSVAQIEAKLKKISEEKEFEIECVRKQAEEKQGDLRNEIEALQVALIKNKETSQVLVDHITLLETDHNVKDADMVALAKLRQEKQQLEAKIDALRKEEIDVIKLQERDQLEEDCQLLRDDVHILKEQLAKRTTNEAALAAQVASLAQQLSETSQENNNSTTAFASRIQNLEEERKNMRVSIHILTRKLFKVGNIIKNMSDDQDRMIDQAKNHEKQMHMSAEALSAIMEQLNLQSSWIQSAMEEHLHLRENVERQEKDLMQNQQVRNDIFTSARKYGDQLIVASSKNMSFLDTVTSIKDALSEVMDKELKELPADETAFSNADDLVDHVMEQILPNGSAELVESSDETGQEEDTGEVATEEPAVVEALGDEPAVDETAEEEAGSTEEENAVAVTEEKPGEDDPVMEEEIVEHVATEGMPAGEEEKQVVGESQVGATATELQTAVVLPPASEDVAEEKKEE